MKAGLDNNWQITYIQISFPFAPSVKSHPGVGGISLSSQVLEELSTMIHGIDISLFS